MVMNKSLQIYTIKKLLTKHNIDVDTIDVEQLIDSRLTLEENIKKIEKELGVTLTRASESIKMNKLSDDYIEQKNDELLEEYLNLMNLDTIDEEIKDELTILNEEKEITENRINELFDKLRTKAIEYLSSKLFPHLVGEQYNDIRKAVLLMLASMSEDRKRRRIHILLTGQSGFGKTEVLLWLKENLNAIFVGKHTSEVGLIGDARGSELTEGALAEADLNVICIDELDKFKKNDLNGLLEAMEEGHYTIRKGKIKQTVKARVRVIATCNELSKLPKPLIDRFDFIFDVNAPDRVERADNSEKLVDIFFSDNEQNVEIIKRYLDYISEHEPKPVDLKTIKKLIREYILTTKLNVETLSYRSLELSILRIANAIAKLKKDNVTPSIVLEAIKIKDRTLTDTQIKYLTAIAKNLI